jgi:hypothetical protein
MDDVGSAERLRVRKNSVVDTAVAVEHVRHVRDTP